MKILALVFLFFSNTLFAQRASVTIVDPNIESKELEKIFKVYRASAHESFLPDRALREKQLSEISGLETWDEVKKDIFFMDLKSKDLNSLKKKYPEISVSDLKNLRGRR